MARNSGSTSKDTPKSKKAATPAAKHAQKKEGARAPQPEERARFFDDRTRNDIVGVCIAVFAVALFVTAVMPPDALVTSLVSQGLHLVLGVGAYVLPFFLLIVGASFLIRFEKPHVPARILLGLALVFVAVLVLLSLFTQGAVANPDTLFDAQQLATHGGYIGAGIAWAGLKLFGQVISCIIMVGLIVAGLVIVGFSISGLIEKLREKYAAGASDETTAMDGPSYARMSLHPEKKDAAAAGVPAAQTAVIGGRKKPQRASVPLNAQDTQLLAANGFEQPAAVDKAMTRKLGSKSTEKAAAAASKAGLASKAVPAAEPHPEEGFSLPEMELLDRSANHPSNRESEESLQATALRLQETLADFGINAAVVGWVAGPTVTLFKIDLPSGVRVSRVTALGDDLALALAAPGVRIFAPIPGTNYVGIEVPNRVRQSVLLGDILSEATGGPLHIAIGKDVEGRSIVTDLSKMPHLLIGGTTGSGKSVSINAMIMSILMRATPAEVRFIMIDPKRVEFTPYNGIPHLYVPVVTEPREAASALAWGVAEMERRLKIFSKVGARNIAQYNAKVQQGLMIGENTADELPYIVIIIDELADLMMNVGKEVEFSISRIAQLARAAGIHLIVATQRPSTNVVTGLIKANITNRIAFNVASGIDSRVVLDTPGAENLIGLGDLLFSKPEYAKPQRIQGCYVSEDEINAVVDRLKEQGEPEYHSEILQTNLISLGASAPDGSGGSCENDDPLVWEAAEAVVSSGFGSTSGIQRRLKVGYSRAGRIMDMLEEKGIVGPPNGSKPREILVDAMELETLKAFEAHDASDPSFTKE
ncbi:MAG: DNA translocase FtsK 4TM domain-containing protein [Raoultibacter sp.]